MSTKRFQIYLSTEQHARIRLLAQNKNLTMAELIRQAIDAFLDGDSSSTESVTDSIWSIIGISDNNLTKNDLIQPEQ